MTGPNEQRLIDFADNGNAWAMPGRIPLLEGLTSLQSVLQKVAADPGVMGQSGEAASSTFAATATEVQKQINWIQVTAAIRISQANSIRERARESLAQLPAGSMSGGQEAVVRAAAVGSSLVLGPVAFLAGEGASAAINGYLANQREQAAADAMSTHAAEMDALTLDEPPTFDVWSDGSAGTSPTPADHTAGGNLGRSGIPTFSPVPVGGQPATHGGAGGKDAELDHYGPFFADDPHVNLGTKPPIDLGGIPPEPSPDGPLAGTPTLPGVIPSTPGGGHLGTGSGGLGGGGMGAGLGSGLSAGLVAGGGGAAALSRLARGAGAPGGSLFGGGTSSTAASGRGGGLLGKTSPAASGLGTRGVGGLAGGAAGGGAPGSSTARGAGMRAGTTGATGGSSAAGGGVRGASGGAGTGGSRTAGGAGARGIGGMGGSGSRSERRDEVARGLGGPIAPRMEDDEEIGPRSENAQAGERDE
ncbi:hypothetical protein [uncultured Microbacterium sp.]|uniref:hypothetical protein n=1 Tax=uncultured Microbacterium sp. TaxID=191216 RepID=UPI0025FB41B1|nr:hypothetical protein [uncultured Microbacterium sp.]